MAIAEPAGDLERGEDQVDDSGEDVGVGQDRILGIAAIELALFRDHSVGDVLAVDGHPDHGEDEHDCDEKEDHAPRRRHFPSGRCHGREAKREKID